MKAKTALLGDVGEWGSGGTPLASRQEYYGGDIPWLIIEDLNDGIVRRCGRTITKIGLENSSAKIVPKGTILVAMYGSIGKLGVAGMSCATNQAIAFCKCNVTLVEPRFLFFWLLWERNRFVHAGRGGTQQNISQEFLKDYPITLPALPEQRRIAAVLEQADRLRRTRRYALDLADFFLPTAFLGMFGEPASNERGHPLQAVEELFPTGREGSKCGPFGSALRNEEYTPAGIPVWTMENIAGGEFREEGSLYISPAKYDELKSYTVQNGDILISRAGTVGRMAILATKHERSIIHSNLVRLTLDPQRCLPLYFTILMKHFGSAIGRLKRGAEDAYSFMNTGRISELRIPVPPLTLQRRFAALVAEHERLRAMQREALRQAEHLFQTLLHDAFADSAAKAAPERPLAICR